MLRSVLAIIAGFLLTVVLVFGVEFALITLFHREPVNDSNREPILLVILLASTGVSAAVGGYFAGVVAVRRPQAHALVLGVINLAAGLPMSLTYWRNEPAWYHVGWLAMLLPSTMIGGWMSARQQAVA